MCQRTPTNGSTKNAGATFADRGDRRTPIAWRTFKACSFALLMGIAPAVLAQAPAPAASGAPAVGVECTSHCDIPTKYRQEVAIAESVGQVINIHDKTAWLSTDALRSKGAFQDIPGKGAGWLTEQQDDGTVAIQYVSKVDGHLVAYASARFDPVSASIVGAMRLDPPRPISPRDERLQRAKDLALATEGNLNCGDRPFNTVAFESEEDGVPGILVFLMSAWSDDIAPLGGDEMLRISADGGTVIDRYSQTKGCINMPTQGLDKAVALAASHLTSATPTLFHVFRSLQYDKPIIVATIQNGLTWRVERGRIQLEQSGSEMQKTVQKAKLDNVQGEPE